VAAPRQWDGEGVGAHQGEGGNLYEGHKHHRSEKGREWAAAFGLCCEIVVGGHEDEEIAQDEKDQQVNGGGHK
jgi:hypothetical protein